MERIIRLQTLEEARENYRINMEQDFPEDELKPFFMIEAMLAKNCYRCYGIYEGDELLAYAYLMMSQEGKLVLLDYFAVVAQRRGQGIGSWVLQHILEYAKEFDGIMIEIESVALAHNEQERITRTKRQHFYLMNGCQMMKTTAWVYGVDYTLLTLTNKALPSEACYADEYEAVYQELCTPPMMRNILIHREERTE